ncbi:DUF6950 family protein [Rubellimicrobium aerolatum]|uniref:DUF6950 family protein n=1 Tax=Rubellimicrobium aerolatum TaxID=490979 RepID=A0ABW0SES7_9RHOB|nr:hypothetical protein [Rubellimicrobium aerolatum]MBP1806456.1 cell wall-associated NlpC family hydrolase [Rubellimicrobium aerolatum]
MPDTMTRPASSPEAAAPLLRRPDWQARLVAVLAAARGRPFAWGTWDCALFTAACVEAMTGEDLSAPFRGRYRTRAGGLRVARAAGLADHVAVFAARLPEVAPGLARPGDVVVMAEDALGIAQGRMAYVLAEAGWGLLPLDGATRAFRVGGL